MKSEKRALKLVTRTLDELHATSRVFKEIEATAAREAGGQSVARWQVLSCASSGEWTVPDIARRLGLTRQSVQRLAHALVDDKLARFAPNPDRQNSPYLQLTLEGSQTWASITHAAERLLMELAARARVNRKQLKSARRGLRSLHLAAQKL